MQHQAWGLKVVSDISLPWLQWIVWYQDELGDQQVFRMLRDWISYLPLEQAFSWRPEQLLLYLVGISAPTGMKNLTWKCFISVQCDLWAQHPQTFCSTPARKHQKSFSHAILRGGLTMNIQITTIMKTVSGERKSLVSEMGLQHPSSCGYQSMSQLITIRRKVRIEKPWWTIKLKIRFKQLWGSWFQDESYLEDAYKMNQWLMVIHHRPCLGWENTWA